MPKKILLYTRPLVPPWDEASKNLAWDIAKNSSEDFQFEILTTKKTANLADFDKIAESKKRKTGERFQSFLDKYIGDKIIPRPIFSSARFGKIEKLQLLNFLNKFTGKRFDIIHFPFTPRPLTSFLIKRKLKKIKAKTIQTIATLNDKFYKNPRKLKKILFADIVVAQSNYAFTKLKKAGLQNLALIYPAIDLEKFQPQKKETTLLEKFSINPDDFVILYPGEYVRLRAVDDIIEAFNFLTKNHQSANLSYKLILACRIKSKKDIRKQKQIKRLTGKLGLEKNIVFLETFTDMPKLYNLSNLIIFPVREMTGKFDIPLTLVEAMACKKPVIISDIPVLKEFIQHLKNGIVVPKANPEELAYAIEQLAKFPKEAERIAIGGMNFTKENFDIKKNIKKYETLYRKISDRKQSPDLPL